MSQLRWIMLSALSSASAYMRPSFLPSITSQVTPRIPCNGLRMASPFRAPVRLLATVASRPSDTRKDWKINLLYDSDCPLCMKEVDFLKKRNVEGGIKFTDLNDLTYTPEENGDVNYEQGMRKIHAVMPDGSVVEGVEVFRRIYEIIGLGWVYAVTKLPFVGWAADRAYDVWAENRLRITGRPDLAEVMKTRSELLQQKKYQDDCEKECELDL